MEEFSECPQTNCKGEEDSFELKCISRRMSKNEYSSISSTMENSIKLSLVNATPILNPLSGFRNFCEVYSTTFQKHILLSESNPTILHIAVQLGDYKAVQFLFDSCSNGESVREIINLPKMRNLVYTCVRNTKTLSGNAVNDKSQTLQVLANFDATLFHEGISDPKNYLERGRYESPLFLKNVHVELIKSLIELGADGFKVNYNGETFLHKVCDNLGPAELHLLTEYLIAKSPEETGKLFNTSSSHFPHLSLQKAIQFIQKDTLKCLASVGVTMNNITSGGSSVLQRAVEYNRGIDIIQTLIENGADINQPTPNGSLLQTAASSQNFEALQLFLSKGLYVNGARGHMSPLALSLSSADDKGTAFLSANILLEHGANVNALDGKGNSILHNVVTFAFRCSPDLLIEKVKFLITHGATVNEERIRTTENWLIQAATEVESEALHKLVKLLEELGYGQIFAQTMNCGFHFLEAAVRKHEPLPETLELLQSLGVNFKLKDGKGRSLLLISIRNYWHCKSSQYIESLVTKFGIESNIQDEEGNGVFHLAVAVGDVKRLRSLNFLRYGYINIKNKNGDTPLHLAARQHSKKESLLELISLGADGSLKNEKGETPFDIVKIELKKYPGAKSEMLEFLRREKLDGESIFIAIERRNLDELKLACDSCTRKGLKVMEFWRTYENLMCSPFHVSVKMGFLKGAEYLFDEHNCGNYLLNDYRFSTCLHTCVKLVKNFVEEIESQIEIFKMSLKINPSLLNEGDQKNFGRRCVTFVGNNLPLLFFFIEAGADLEGKDDEGYSFLHYAAENMDEKNYHGLIEYLVDKELFNKIGSKYHSKSPPLHAAVRHLHILEETLDLWWVYDRASFQNLDESGSSIAFAAIEGGTSVSCLELLLHKYDVDYCKINKKLETALHFAVKSGSTTLIEYFIGKGVNINAKDDQGKTPLHWAGNLTWPSFTVFEILLNSGANVELVDNQGRSPLHVLVECGERASDILSIQKINIVRLLIKSGVNSVNIGLVDNRGRNVIHHASRLSAKGFHSICEELVKLGYEKCLTMVDNNGNSPLHLALQNQLVPLPETMELFKTSGMDFSLRETTSLNSLLHIATRALPISHELHSFLLENGIDMIKMRNKGGQTCLHFSAGSGSMESLKLFLKNGSPVNARDLRGDTPLHYLARCDLPYKEMKGRVALLREFGADLLAINRRGQTPMELMQGCREAEGVKDEANGEGEQDAGA